MQDILVSYGVGLMTKSGKQNKTAPVKTKTVNKLNLTVCLPIQLIRNDGQQNHLENTSNYLKNSKWTILDNENAVSKTDDEQTKFFQQYQKHAYFHPFVRRFLLDTNRVRLFARDDVESVTVDLTDSKDNPLNIELLVSRCELVLFQPNIAIFLLQVIPKDDEALALDTIQKLQDTFRRLYPPYYFYKNNSKLWTGGHCPNDVTIKFNNQDTVSSKIYQLNDTNCFRSEYINNFNNLSEDHNSPLFQWANHWQALLNPFTFQTNDNEKIRVQHLGDDRAPILSWIALDDIKQVSHGDWIRLCFADEPGSSRLPYAGAFMQDFEKNHCYDRYWYQDNENTMSPSRILNCGYAFSYVGSVHDGFFTNTADGAHFTFNNLYIDMGIIAHFQNSALLTMSNELSGLVHRDSSSGAITFPKREEVLGFYDKFVEFTQNYWFDEISPQQQGVELFDMWRKHLNTQKLYDEIHQELKDLVDYSELRATEELNDILTFLTVAGIIFAIVSLYIAVYSMEESYHDCWSMVVTILSLVTIIAFFYRKQIYSFFQK